MVDLAPYLSVMNNIKQQTTRPVIRALIYARASQDRLKLMHSIKDPIHECRAWCKPLEWKVVRVVTDADRSASRWATQEREGFDEAMRIIESGRIDGFVTWEPSRAGRDMEIYVQLRAACQKAGVLYLTQGRVYDFARSDDNFLLGFEFLRAEADANTMRERQLRTVRINAEKGRPHGRIPFGYRRVYDTSNGTLIGQEPDPHTGDLERTMAREILDGVPASKVAKRMQDLGEPTPQGPRKGRVDEGWTSTTVKQMLRNPTIAGKRVFRGQVIGDAEWEALVSPEDFVRLQRILYDPARRVHLEDGVTPKSLLSHIALCDYCGRPLHRVLQKAKSDAPRVVRYQCRFRGCFKIVIGAVELDDYVSEYTLSWLSNPANTSLLSGVDDNWIEHSIEARNRLAELETMLQEATQYSAAGKMSLAVLAGLEQTLQPEIEQARQQLVLPIADRTLRELILTDNLTTTWYLLDLGEQRRVIKALFEIRIGPAPRRGPHGFQPERVTITPRAKGGEARSS